MIQWMIQLNILRGRINSFHANTLFLYPLKTSEHLKFSNVFMEYKRISCDKFILIFMRNGPNF